MSRGETEQAPLASEGNLLGLSTSKRALLKIMDVTRLVAQVESWRLKPRPTRSTRGERR